MFSYTLHLSLPNLDTEANNFFHRAHELNDAALLTRYYTQHALYPYIDSVSYIRHFINIQSVKQWNILFVCLFVCLFDLILYIPSTIFQL